VHAGSTGRYWDSSQEKYWGGVVTYTCANGTACFLYPTPNAGTSRASQAFWQVADIDAEMSGMRSRGVRFEHYEVPGAPPGSDIVDAGGARSAWFKDSEGNILAMIQSL